jgi:diaminohydroxyphosphoribosylaminopyrimidine deaminase/5-amino-6-(5-phosphoribosylamino)uracil reductase
LLEDDLVDTLVGFTAGVVIGAEGVPGIGALGVAKLARAPRFTLHSTQAVGPDVVHIWTRP